MYLYAPPFSIVKEKFGKYTVSDILGGKYIFEGDDLSKILLLCGKKLKERGIKDYDSLIEKGFFVPIQNPRKGYFNYKRVVSQISKDHGKKGDLMNIGSVTFALIKNCPYSCNSCYATKSISSNAGSFFDEKILNQTMKDISMLGANHISISGGEPTFSSQTVNKAKKLSEMAYGAGIENRLLITTGFGLERFVEQILELSITDVQISIDGLEDYNDSYKNFKGATKKSLQAVKSCINRGINFSVNTVISKQNTSDLSTFIKSLDYIGVKKLRVSRIITKNENLMLNNRESKELEEIINQNKNSGNVNISSFLDNCYIQRDYLNCVAGKLYAHIDCFGNVFPCAFLQNKPIGNLKNSNFPDMWNINNPVIKKFYDGKEIPGNCIDCDDRYYCFGNCFKEYELSNLKCQKN